MTSRSVRLCSASLFLSVVVGLQAQAPGTPTPQVRLPPAPASARPATTPAPDDEMVSSLKLPDADIDTILNTLENLTGKIILRPAALPTAPGGYNLKITKPIPKSQAILYLETILAMNNIAVIPMGPDALKIVQLGFARTEAPELITESTLDMPPSSKVASKLFQLQFLRVQEFQQVLTTMMNPNLGNSLITLANANAFVVTDTITNLQRIETLLQDVDKPTSGGVGTKFYQLHNGAKASDVVTKLRGILTGPLQTQIGLATSYSADDRTNQVILITDPRQFPFFDDLIAKLDVNAETTTRNEVIYLKHAKAADVVTVLTHIIQGQTQNAQKQQSFRAPGSPQPVLPTPSTAPGATAAPAGPNIVSGSSGSNAANESGASEFSSLVTVVNDERSNSVVVSGTVDDIRLMRELISKLDGVLPQVRIDVLVAEVALENDHESGISALGLLVENGRLVGFTGASTAGISIGSLASGTSSGSSSTSTTSSSTYATTSRIGGPGSLGRSIDLSATIGLQSWKTRQNTSILSVPSVTTSHAKQAVFLSSEKRPIVTGTSSTPLAGASTTTNQTVTQQDIGITLTVTPLIGSDNSVQMDVDADVQDVQSVIQINGVDQPIISHRETKSTITANSGDIIVIGGMQRNKDDRVKYRLGPIPIIGDLLGRRSNTIQRTELIFFLRPTVLTNDPKVDNSAAIKQLQGLPDSEVKGKEQMLKQVDPTYQPPPKKSMLDKILPK